MATLCLSSPLMGADKTVPYSMQSVTSQESVSEAGGVENFVDELKYALKRESTVLTPESIGYDAAINRWAVNAIQKAGLVILPICAEDVAAAVLFSQKRSLELVVCAGMHATSFAASTSGGLCINLSKMRDVAASVSAMTITCQGGALWGDVDRVAGRSGIAVVGGTVNRYGWLSGRHGLAIDNLLSAEVVRADGRIVTASKESNSDLFWAIRGAGSCFGMVTSFTFRAHKQINPIWGGHLIWPVSAAEHVVDFANQLMATTKGDSAMHLGLATAPQPQGQVVIFAVVLHNGPKADAVKQFEPLLNGVTPLMDGTKEMPYHQINRIMNSFTSYGDRKTSKGSTFTTPLSAGRFQNMIDNYRSFISEVPDVSQSVCMLEFYKPDTINAVAQDATTFANRGNYHIALIAPRWTKTENDSVCSEWATSQTYLISEGEQERHNSAKSLLDGVRAYGNYESFGASAESIFGGNYERLVQLKQIYDPTNVFRKSYDLAGSA